MEYTTFRFRAADRETLLSGVQQVFSDEGIDPSRILTEGLDGNLHVDPSIGLFLGPGQWWETLPEFDENGISNDPVRGDHALVNVRTNDEVLHSVLASIDPGESRAGIERVAPSTPVREFA